MVTFAFSLHSWPGPAGPGGPGGDREARPVRRLSPALASETEVLRIAVDQVEILGGHGEERLDLLLEELLRLGETLAGGALCATALFGPEPVELAVTREEGEVRLTVLIHGMPPRLLLHRQRLPLADLLEQIAGLSRAVAGRLVGPEPETSPLRRRLQARAGHLERPPSLTGPGAEPRPPPALPAPRRWSVAPEGELELSLALDPATLPGPAPSTELGELRIGGWCYRGLLLPFLEALLEELNHALAVLEEGSFAPLPFGEVTLEPEADGGALHLGAEQLSLPLPRLLEAVLGLFGEYLEAGIAAGGAHPPARLLEADEARRALLFRLRLDQVEGGRALPSEKELRPRRAPERPGPAFGPGDLRHVGLRRSWVSELDVEGALALQAHHRTLVLSSPSEQVFADSVVGALRHRVPGARATLPLPGHRDFLLLEAAGLERRGPEGRVRWHRELGPLADQVPALGAGGLHVMEDARHLLGLELSTGALRWRALSATDPGGRRWLLPLGQEVLLIDESGVVERFTAEGRCRLRGSLGLRPERAPELLPDGRLLVLGRTGGVLSAALLRPEDAEPATEAAGLHPLPALAGLSGVLHQGSRLLIWGPPVEGSSAQAREEVVWSTALDGRDPRLLHRAPAPLAVIAWRGGYLAVDGHGRCLGPGLAPGEGVRLELGAGEVGLLRFGKLVVATAERLVVLHPEGRRVLGATDLAPAEGPVVCCRGPGRSLSLVDGHGCLQRFAVAGHLSVV